MIFLVGFDGSNTSKEALDLACQHAKAFNAGIEIVRSMEEGKTEDNRQIRSAEKELEWAESLVTDRGISAKTHLLIRGMTPGEDVVQFASEISADALFIGIRRRSKMGKLLFGSNAQYMILKAHCPVVTVK